jgi:tRNA (guanine-N7-)-methyltransferase
VAVPSANMTVPWRALFANDRPVEVEIGPGRGDVLLAFAAARPDVNFFAIERARRGAESIPAKAARRELTNVRIIAGDARCIVGQLVPDASVSAYHVYFPDPWPKRRHRRRRLADLTFARDLARTLAVGGALHLATDLPALLEDFAAQLVAAGLQRRSGVEPPARPRTSFEQRYAQAGTHYARFDRPDQETGLRLPR